MDGLDGLHAGIQILSNHDDGSIRQYKLVVFSGEEKPFVYLCECSAGEVYETRQADLVDLAMRTLKLLGVTDQDRVIH